MTVKLTNGTAVAKADLDTTPYEAEDPQVVVNDDVWEEVEIPGSTRTSTRRLAHAGQRVRQSEVDRWYPAATVTAVSPTTGAAAGGTAITVTGKNLRGVTAVKIGDTNCTGTLVVTEGRITGAITPAKAAGAHAVTVVDDSGTTVNVTPTFTTA